MTAADYKRIREECGTQVQVARQLGVSQETISRRETGRIPIMKEAELALLALRMLAKKPEAGELSYNLRLVKYENGTFEWKDG